MTRLSLLLPLTLLLAACVPYTPGPSSPDEMVYAGQAMQTATQSAIEAESTQVARQAAKEERQTKREIELQMAPVTAQAAMLELQITAGAATDTASQKTATATAAVATAVYSSAIATETKMSADHRQAREDALALGRDIAWAMIAGAFLGIGLYLAYWFVLRWQNHTIAQDQMKLDIERQQSSFRVIDGVICYFSVRNGEPQVLIPGKGQKMPVIDGFTPLEDVTPGAPADINKLAIEIVDRGIRMWGDYSIQIPGHRAMGWSASKWTRVVEAWKQRGIVDAIEGDKTYLREQGGYTNLKALYDALVSGRLIMDAVTPLNTWAGD